TAPLKGPAGVGSSREDGPHAAGGRGPAVPRAEEAPRAAARSRREGGGSMTCDVTSEISGTSDCLDCQERLNEVLLVYVEALQEGRRPDRQELLAAHPDLRSDLETFFAGHDEVERLAAPLRAAAT